MRNPSRRNTTSHSFKGKVWKKGKFIKSEFFIENRRIKEGRRGKTIEASFITPPFADPHIHGGWGHSFQEGEFEPLEERLRKEGIFFAIPTLQNDSPEHMKQIAVQFTQYKKENPRSIFPFLRIEGPFISSEKKGVQPARFIQKPSKELIESLLSIEEIKLLTFAPEVKGVDGFVEKALKRGKIPSFGHSNAEFKDFLKFYIKGVRHMTHFPNAMRGLHHREIGLLGAGLSLDDLHLEIIADGIHNSFEFISLLLKIKGPAFSIISDLIPPAFSSLEYFEGRKIVKDGMRLTAEGGTLAGGSATVPEQVKLLSRKGVKPEELIRIASLNAPEFFGCPSPSLEEGESATFLLLDDEMSVRAVYTDGEKIR